LGNIYIYYIIYIVDKNNFIKYIYIYYIIYIVEKNNFIKYILYNM